MSGNISVLNSYINFLGEMKNHHSFKDLLYSPLKNTANTDIAQVFGPEGEQESQIDNVGCYKLPFLKMGNVNSVNLLDLDELILFAFYRANRNRYTKIVDIGANIGAHSIYLGLLGFQITSYEPDPEHWKKLNENLVLNGVENQVKPVQAAVSDNYCTKQFIRLLGNTTGSHLAGAKANPYGDMERFDVQVLDIKPIIKNADLLKIDAEGEEATILLATSESDWESADAIVEVGSEKNAALIYEHFKRTSVNLFAQKGNWSPVSSLEEMPTSYKEGSLFISTKPEMHWK